MSSIQMNQINTTTLNTNTHTPETKPKANIWEVRKAAQMAALEATKALEALRKAETAKREAPKQVLEKVEVVPETKPQEKKDDGFTTVSYKRNYPKKEKPVHTYEKPRVSTSTKPSSIPASPRLPPAVYQAIRDKKKKALDMAQDIMIRNCLSICSPVLQAEINTNAHYVLGYRKTLTLDISDDDLTVKCDGEDFTFSKLQFLENRTFQYKLREQFSEVMPNVWVRIFPGRSEGTFAFSFQKRKD